MAHIKIIVAKDGKVTTETNGIKSGKCLGVTKFLGSLGEVAIQKTSEFYEDAQPTDVMINTQQS